jgi:hypothetical protein
VRDARTLRRLRSYHQHGHTILTLSINQSRRHSSPSPSRPASAIPPSKQQSPQALLSPSPAVAAAVGCACSFPVLCELRGARSSPVACVLGHPDGRFLPFSLCCLLLSPTSVPQQLWWRCGFVLEVSLFERKGCGNFKNEPRCGFGSSCRWLSGFCFSFPHPFRFSL